MHVLRPNLCQLRPTVFRAEKAEKALFPSIPSVEFVCSPFNLSIVVIQLFSLNSLHDTRGVIRPILVGLQPLEDPP